MKLDIEYVNKRLGLELKEKDVIDLLAKMGHGYDKKGKQALIPAYRADLLHPIDLIEDIAIAYGYENFEEIIPKVATVAKEAEIEIIKRKISSLLVGLGLSELYTYNITSDAILEQKYGAKKPIMLKNSLSEEFNALRNEMIPSLLDVLSRNRHNEYPQKVFDVGTCFSKSKNTETGIKEEEVLAVALCGEDIDFTKIKQVLDYIGHNLTLEIELKEQSTTEFLEGRTGSILIKGKSIGKIGEIHPAVLEKFGIEYPVASFEINLTELMNFL